MFFPGILLADRAKLNIYNLFLDKKGKVNYLGNFKLLDIIGFVFHCLCICPLLKLFS